MIVEIEIMNGEETVFRELVGIMSKDYQLKSVVEQAGYILYREMERCRIDQIPHTHGNIKFSK